MLKRIKIWQFILGLLTIIILLRIPLLINIIKLFFVYTGLIFSNASQIISHTNFSLIDVFIELFLLIFLYLWILFKRNKINFLKSSLSTLNAVAIILIICFLFAPLITDENPDFQKNISVTKLLPPFSSVKVIHLKNQNDLKKSKLSSFYNLRKEVIKNSFDESIIFADSVNVNSQLIYFQNGKEQNINENKLVLENGKPLITSKLFIIGSDEFGRDIFTRLIYGARISLFIGLGSVGVSLLVGLLLGFLAGYVGGGLDTILNRITEMFLSFPIIFLIIAILALFGNSMFSVIIVLGFSGWMTLFKIVKGEMLIIKKKDYFISANMIGLSKKQLLFNEVLPVILAPVIVNVIFQFGNVILAESALSFLGLGVGNSYPSWGAMIEAGQEYLNQAWWMMFFPGIILVITLLTANKLGRDLNKFYNPRLTK